MSASEERLTAAMNDLSSAVTDIGALPSPRAGLDDTAPLNHSMAWVQLYGHARRVALLWKAYQQGDALTAWEQWRAALDRLEAEPETTP